MKSLTMLATAAALAIAFAAPVASAQTPPPAHSAVMPDHSMRASMLIGMKVLDDKGEPLGTVVEILVQDKAAEPTAIVAVLDLGRLATKHVAVPLSHLKVEGTQMMMPGVTRKQFIAMPLYDYEGDGRTH